MLYLHIYFILYDCLGARQPQNICFVYSAHPASSCQNNNKMEVKRTQQKAIRMINVCLCRSRQLANSVTRIYAQTSFVCHILRRYMPSPLCSAYTHSQTLELHLIPVMAVSLHIFYARPCVAYVWTCLLLAILHCYCHGWFARLPYAGVVALDACRCSHFVCNYLWPHITTLLQHCCRFAAITHASTYTHTHTHCSVGSIKFIMLLLFLVLFCMCEERILN